MAPPRKYPIMLRDCEHCGKPVPRTYITKRGYDRGRDGGIRFCSKACANYSRGPAKGWIHKRTGYRMFNIGGRQISEHQLVMEKVLGRRLEKHETVHHKDGDRLNNHPNNLEVWSGRHGRGQRLSDLAPHLRHSASTNDLIVGALSLGG